MDPKTSLSNFLVFSKLSFQFLGLMAKARNEHKKAKATFQKTLILHGVPSEAAQELAKAYPNPMDEVLNLMSRGINRST